MAGMANIPVFDGTNYREWIDEIDSFFQLTGLWYIASGFDIPVEPEKPETPTPEERREYQQRWYQRG